MLYMSMSILQPSLKCYLKCRSVGAKLCSMRRQIYYSPCRDKYSASNIVINKIYFQVRKTETIWKNLNPSWKVLYIPTLELCDGNWQMPLNLEVFDEDQNWLAWDINHFLETLDISNVAYFYLFESKLIANPRRG